MDETTFQWLVLALLGAMVTMFVVFVYNLVKFIDDCTVRLETALKKLGDRLTRDGGRSS